MTSHELARALLDLPDLPVEYEDLVPEDPEVLGLPETGCWIELNFGPRYGEDQ